MTPFWIIILREVANPTSARFSSQNPFHRQMSLPHMHTARMHARCQCTQWPPTIDGLKSGGNRISLLQVFWQSPRCANTQITTEHLGPSLCCRSHGVVSKRWFDLLHHENSKCHQLVSASGWTVTAIVVFERQEKQTLIFDVS